MSHTDILSDIKERLYNTNIYAVRQIARVVGVSSPTSGTKGSIINDIVAIATLQVKPAPRSPRGAPPKSADYDEDIVNRINECMKYYEALRNGGAIEVDNNTMYVSDGTQSSHRAGIFVREGKIGFLRVNGCLASSEDIFVPESYINRFRLKDGDFVEGECRSNGYETAGLASISYINGVSPSALQRRSYESLTPVYPHERIDLGVIPDGTAARMVDMFAPVGKGQRAVISAPENAGKIDLIKQIATAISRDESISLVLFLIAERPEVVTDIKRSVDGAKIFHTSFETEQKSHGEAAEVVVKLCKSAMESGNDVVLITDGLSKLGTAAKGLLSSAICAEEGGSLTVIATVSAEGEYSSEHSAELISYSNMRVILSKDYAAERTFPAIDILKSGTDNCELLQSSIEFQKANAIRKRFKSSGNISEIIELFKQTKSNTDITNG